MNEEIKSIRTALIVWTTTFFILALIMTILVKHRFVDLEAEVDQLQVAAEETATFTEDWLQEAEEEIEQLQDQIDRLAAENEVRTEDLNEQTYRMREYNYIYGEMIETLYYYNMGDITFAEFTERMDYLEQRWDEVD